jgi:hypothetical protein
MTPLDWYLRGVFNELIRLGFWAENNPLARLRQFKIAERELSYLNDDEIRALLTTTLRAEVLATLLAGDDMAGMDSVFSNGSTKLATVMRALTRR